MDFSGSLPASHIRQAPVDETDTEFIAQLDGLSGTKHRLLAGKRPLCTHSRPDEHFGHAVAGIKILVCHQRLPPRQLCYPFLTAQLCLEPQRHTNDEFGALVRLGSDLDGPAHHIHNIFGDRHTQSGALYPAHRGGSLPLEGVKDPLRKFRAHADPVILDVDLIHRSAAL